MKESQVPLRCMIQSRCTHIHIHGYASSLTATLGLRYDLMHTAIHYDASAYMQMSANVMGKKDTYVLDSSLDHEVSDDYSQLLPKFGLNLKIDELGSNVYAPCCAAA